MSSHKSLVQDLLESGLTQKELGGLLQKSQAWVGAVLADKFSDLKWKDGEALRALHRQRGAGAVSPADTGVAAAVASDDAVSENTQQVAA